MRPAAWYFSRKRGLAAFMAAGPLSAVLDELAAALEATGHSVATVQGYVRSARHVTYALEHRQLARGQVTLSGLLEFARAHRNSCRCPHPERSASANFRSCMAHLLPILQRRGLAAAARPRAPFAEVLSELDAYTAEVRGVSDETRSLTRRALIPVLATLMRRGRFDAARLTGPALQQYVAAMAERRAPSTVARVVVAIRSALRFLQARGVDTGAAMTMVKGPRRPRFRPSRKALTPPQLRTLFAPLLRRSDEPLALRELAILLFLGQLGLRRSDVARLELQDLDARARHVDGSSEQVAPGLRAARGGEIVLPLRRRARAGRPAHRPARARHPDQTFDRRLIGYLSADEVRALLAPISRPGAAVATTPCS